VIDQELRRVMAEPVTEQEMARASARFELGLLGGLETADGKASTIGFYEAVLGRPAAAFERLETTRRLTQSDLLRAARRYLDPAQRSVILVRPELAKPAAEAAQ
jgi:zinc protease